MQYMSMSRRLMSAIRDIDTTLICSTYINTEIEVVDNYLSLMYIMEANLADSLL